MCWRGRRVRGCGGEVGELWDVVERWAYYGQCWRCACYGLCWRGGVLLAVLERWESYEMWLRRWESYGMCWRCRRVMGCVGEVG